MRQTAAVTDVRPAESSEPGRWLLRSDVDWWDLVRYGPPGFDVYVRIAFSPEGADPMGEAPALRRALAALAAFTGTPATAYAAVWEGWTGGATPPQAPRVPIPHREMLLLTGPVDVLRDAPALAWHGSAQGAYQEPHLVWPQDQAWCLACEVDEEVEFTVGCADDAARALSTALPGAVRRVHYREAAPLYRDQA